MPDSSATNNSSDRPNTLLEHALAYASHGWRVHPLRARDKVPVTKNGCKDATTDEKKIREWWSKFPNANIGLATGYDFFAIDIDPKGMSWYEAENLPATHESVTGRGGRHVLYRMPSGYIVHNSTGNLAEGVDVRGIGGYIVAPPSIHPSGTIYSWLDCDGLVPDGPCADAPPEIIAALAEKPASSNGNLTVPGTIKKGVQHTTLHRFASSLRAKGFGQPEIEAALILAAKRCEDIPPDSHMVRLAESVCKLYQPGLSPDFAAKQRKPATAPEIIDAEYSDIEFHGHDYPPDDNNKPERAKLTPNAIADKILEHHQIINVDGWLYEYTGKFWKQIGKERLLNLAFEADGRYHTQKSRRSEIESYIRSSVFRPDQQWNLIQDYEVPLSNGVLDIRSMSLRPHRSEDMLTACPSIGYNPSAQCPTWMRCLDQWFPLDDTHATTLQEFGGYCLMSRAELKTALMVIGPSDCGKTVYSNILREIVGIENTCCVTPDAMDDPMKVAPIMGKMVNIVPELSDGSEIADGGFKRLISTGEGVAIRKLYHDQIVYVPHCKHIFIANSPPRVKDESEGVYNRLLYVTYSVVIDKTQQDQRLHEKLMAEREGILLWMLEGLQRVVLNGRRFSPGGRRDLKNYRDSQNPIHAFIADECELPEEDTDEMYRVHLPDIRAKFSQWSGRPADPRYMVRILKQAGFDVTDNAVHIGHVRRRAVIGLRLRQG